MKITISPNWDHHPKCHFCGSEEASVAEATNDTYYKAERTRLFSRTGYVEVDLQIPRCKSCKKKHSIKENIVLLLFLWFALFFAYFFYVKWFWADNVVTIIMALFIIFFLVVFCVWLLSFIVNEMVCSGMRSEEDYCAVQALQNSFYTSTSEADEKTGIRSKELFERTIQQLVKLCTNNNLLYNGAELSPSRNTTTEDQPIKKSSMRRFLAVGSLFAICASSAYLVYHDYTQGWNFDSATHDKLKYTSHRLSTGDIPYYEVPIDGENAAAIKVENNIMDPAFHAKIADAKKDLVVIIKQGESIVRSRYVRAGGKCTIPLPNGAYQIYFYRGNSWNPNKRMGRVQGGFLENEEMSKPEDIELEYNTLSYVLERHYSRYASPKSKPKTIFE